MWLTKRNAFLATLFPQLCCFCGCSVASRLALCATCKQALPWLGSCCSRCGIPLGHRRDCGRCLQQPPSFQHCYGLFHYQAPIKQLIWQCKFREEFRHAALLGKLITEKITTDWYQDKPLPEALVAVPLYRKRLQQRGFNQALEITKPIARRLNKPIANAWVKRIKNTAQQSLLQVNERSQNVAEAFSVIKPLPFKHVAVIDDVVTTGHTVNELTRCLKANGAAQVDIWCVARAAPLANGQWH